MNDTLTLKDLINTQEIYDEPIESLTREAIHILSDNEVLDEYEYSNLDREQTETHQLSNDTR
tara:strand:+ start:830 stop:1015 length:186 start_codon:yes stop_codon:yes gene_type:complete